eukprot:c24392_g4_i3 orf=1-2412(-)
MELQALQAMLVQAMPVSRDTMYHHLQHCVKSKDLPAAKQAHCLMVSNGLHAVAALGDVLIRFFASCGCLLDAYLVFCSVLEPSLYTWHAIISAHATVGHYERALELWREMQEDAGVQPDKVAFLCILKTCGCIGVIQQGSLVYKQVIITGFIRHAPIQSALIAMYATCGSINDARKVFDVFTNQDVVIWGTMLSAYAQHGEALAALELYRKMHHQGIEPDKVIFLCILKAVSSAEEVMVGKAVHHEIIMKEVELDVVLGSTLVDMYAKCGSMEDAQLAFDKLPNRNAVTWNAVIAGYVQHGHGFSALELYSRMQHQSSLKPEKVTFLCTLKACGCIGAVEQGRLLHDQIIRCQLEQDLALDNTLIDMYAKCGSINEACKVFSSARTREVVSWNSLIGGYTQQGQALHALGLFGRMQNVGVPPDMVTFTCALKACASIEALESGQLIHDQMVRLEVEVDVVVGSALVDMYCKCKSLKEGRKVFEELQGANVVSWNAIISGCVQAEHDHLAFELFDRMQHEGVEPNDATFSCILKACSNSGNIEGGRLVHYGIIKGGLEVDAILICALVDTYAKCGSSRESCWVFDRLPNRNVAAWAALIGGYVQNGASLKALEMFQKMQREGMKPDKVTFLCVLKASTMSGAVEEGMLIHDQILRGEFGADVAVGNTLVDMYAKCGALAKAQHVLEELPFRDVVSWSALIAGYAQQGQGEQALKCFKRMQQEGIPPDVVTLCCVLNVCSHLGLVEEGHMLFMNMSTKYGVKPNLEAYTCMIDVFGRAGHLDKAVRLIREMPFSDNSAIWHALLGA